MSRAARGGRRASADAVIDQLRTADRFTAGDPRRDAAQRHAARLVADDLDVLADPRLASMSTNLRRWARLAPYLLTDADERRLAERNRRVVADHLAALRRIDSEPSASLERADLALRGLDAPDASARARADREAHSVTDRRAPAVAAVLGALAQCHLADDAERGITDWRTRFAIVQGTTTGTLATLRDAVAHHTHLAAHWWHVRSAVVGGAYCDRRAGPPAATASLAQHTEAVARAIADAQPSLAELASTAAANVVPGSVNEVVVEADGRLSATVAHRPTPRGRLMVAHETGHALHAHAALGADPPGALVGETVACWASLVTGQAHATLAGAIALGDVLVEELFVSAAVGSFEDAVYDLARRDQVSVATLDEAWLRAHRELWGSAVEVPDHVASGWARLPSLATDPGHALSYSWATLLALATGPRGEHVEHALQAGGVDADEFTAMLGHRRDEWIHRGLRELESVLGGLGQLVESSG